MKRTSSSPVTVTWYGHSAFHIRPSAGPSILIDPWLDNPRAPQGAKESVAAEIILVTHGHADHLGNTVEIAKRTGARVIAMYELSLYFRSQGLTDVTSMNKGGSVETGGARITMVDAKHSSCIESGGGVMPGGEAAGFIVRYPRGPAIYHAGDTSLFGDMKLIGQLYSPAIVMLPIGDLYTMAPREAAVACRMLSPRHIVGMHYGTFPALTGTPAELRKHLPANFRKKVAELRVGVAARFS